MKNNAMNYEVKVTLSKNEVLSVLEQMVGFNEINSVRMVDLLNKIVKQFMTKDAVEGGYDLTLTVEEVEALIAVLYNVCNGNEANNVVLADKIGEQCRKAMKEQGHFWSF